MSQLYSRLKTAYYRQVDVLTGITQRHLLQPLRYGYLSLHCRIRHRPAFRLGMLSCDEFPSQLDVQQLPVARQHDEVPLQLGRPHRVRRAGGPDPWRQSP